MFILFLILKKDMRRIKHPFLFTLLLSVILIACHSNTQQANARPYTNGFHEAPIATPVMPMVYDTTSPQVQEIIHQLDKFYQGQVRAGFNGGVLIGYKGAVIYERYFGFANKERKVPEDATSSSQLASVSKTFTGAAVLYLYQHKYLDIDKPVQYYISNFPYPEITLRMCLCHRSGLPDYTHWVPNYHKDTRTPIDNEEMLNLMAAHKPALEFRPGKRFTYSNTNYATLARVIEIVTQMTYSEFMTKYIFRPLGMQHTFVYSPNAGLPANAAISYKHNWIREPDMFADGVCGDKGIYSTPEDMYRWDQSFYQNRLLSNETIEMAYGPCSFERPGVKNYGLGWRMLCFPNGNKIIYHNGWWHGNNTSFYRFIKDNFTIIVLGNRFTNTIYHHAPAIFSIVRGVSADAGFDTGD